MTTVTQADCGKGLRPMPGLMGIQYHVVYIAAMRACFCMMWFM
jgi:hypothetical protein